MNETVDKDKVIARLVQQNANMNLQLQMLAIALEDEIAKNLKDGEKDGDTKQA